MGLLHINCRGCGELFAWFTGDPFQLCSKCRAYQAPCVESKPEQMENGLVSAGIAAFQPTMSGACGTSSPYGMTPTPAGHRSILIDYLLAKVQESDWHGVSDAANDLRVLEAQHPEIVP